MLQVRENAGDWAGLLTPSALHDIQAAVTDLLAAIRPDACAIGGCLARFPARCTAQCSVLHLGVHSPPTRAPTPARWYTESGLHELDLS